MTSAITLAIALAVSLILSTIMVSVLLKPLRLVLATLCERGEGVPFWAAFTSLMLYLAPLFVTVVRQGGVHVEAQEAAEIVRMSLSTAVLGAFLALLPIGWKIATSRPRAPDAPAKTMELDRDSNR
jgi:hypothetical protein